MQSPTIPRTGALHSLWTTQGQSFRREGSRNLPRSSASPCGSHQRANWAQPQRQTMAHKREIGCTTPALPSRTRPGRILGTTTRFRPGPSTRSGSYMPPTKFCQEHSLKARMLCFKVIAGRHPRLPGTMEVIPPPLTGLCTPRWSHALPEIARLAGARLYTYLIPVSLRIPRDQGTQCYSL
jgi:hypothetical protein